MNQKFLLFLICWFAFAYPLSAQTASNRLDTLSLEELMNIPVSTASKQEESIKDAAAVLSVITNNEINTYGAINISDLLDRVTNTYFNSGYTFRDNIVAFRGNATADINTNILILIDGRPFRESLLNGLNAPVYMSFPLERIDHIEIIRGPGSVFYGTCALVGVINVITKSVAKSAPLTARFQYGTFQSYQGSLSAAKKLGKLELATGISYFNSDGWKMKTRGAPFYIPAGSQFVANPAPDSANMYKDNLGINVNAKLGKLKASINYLTSKQADMGLTSMWFSFIEPNTTDFNTTINRWMIDIGYSTQITKNWEAEINLTTNTLELQKKYVSFQNFRDKGDSRDHLLEFVNYLHPSENLKLTIGGLANYQSGNYMTYSKQNGQQMWFNDTVRSTGTQLLKYDQLWWSIYGQGEYKLNRAVKLIAGFQGNKVTNLKFDLVPRVALVANFSKNTGVKVMYGKAFRSPSQYERNANNPPDIMSNPNLKPEKIGTFETQLFFIQNQYEIYLTYYTSNQFNVIRQIILPYAISDSITADALQYINGGTLHSHGFELEGKAYLNQYWSVTLSASAQSIKDSQEDKDIFGMPGKMAKIGVTYKHPSGISLAIFNSFFGAGTTITTDPRANINPTNGSFAYLSANLQYNVGNLLKMKHALVLGAYATNLLNEKVYYPEYSTRKINTLPGRAPRAINVSLAYRF